MAKQKYSFDSKIHIYKKKIYKIVCFPLSEINNLPTAEEDSLKIIFLAKLFSLRCFFCFS